MIHNFSNTLTNTPNSLDFCLSFTPSNKVLNWMSLVYLHFIYLHLSSAAWKSTKGKMDICKFIITDLLFAVKLLKRWKCLHFLNSHSFFDLSNLDSTNHLLFNITMTSGSISEQIFFSPQFTWSLSNISYCCTFIISWKIIFWLPRHNTLLVFLLHIWLLHVYLLSRLIAYYLILMGGVPQGLIFFCLLILHFTLFLSNVIYALKRQCL